MKKIAFAEVQAGQTWYQYPDCPILQDLSAVRI